MKQIAKKVGIIVLIIALVVFAIYFTYTAERAMDYFNIGVDNS